MPTYQYRCPHCGHEFEVFQSIVENPVAECPECGRMPRRIITGGAGFILKGNGFYATDYRSEAYKRAAKKETEASDTSTKKDKKDSSAPAARKTEKSGPKEQ